MSEKRTTRHDPWIYAENRSKISYEELSKYFGHYVAWSSDGTHVVAHHEDPDETVRLVEEAGVSLEDVVLCWFPPEGEVSLL